MNTTPKIPSPRVPRTPNLAIVGLTKMLPAHVSPDPRVPTKATRALLLPVDFGSTVCEGEM